MQGVRAPRRSSIRALLERTAVAERHEPKGYLPLELAAGPAGGSVTSWTFHDLQARPMEVRTLRVRGLSATRLQRELRSVLASVSLDAVLRLEADDAPEGKAARVLSAERLRTVAPLSMNVDVVVPDWRGPRSRRRAAAAVALQHLGAIDLVRGARG